MNYNWTQDSPAYRPYKHMLGVRNFLVQGRFLGPREKKRLYDVIMAIAPNKDAQAIISTQYGECQHASEQLGDLYLANTIYIGLHDDIWPWEESERQRKVAKLAAFQQLIKRR